jgi:hypothetical protein
LAAQTELVPAVVTSRPRFMRAGTETFERMLCDSTMRFSSSKNPFSWITKSGKNPKSAPGKARRTVAGSVDAAADGCVDAPGAADAVADDCGGVEAPWVQAVMSNASATRAATSRLGERADGRDNMLVPPRSQRVTAGCVHKYAAGRGLI